MNFLIYEKSPAATRIINNILNKNKFFNIINITSSEGILDILLNNKIDILIAICEKPTEQGILLFKKIKVLGLDTKILLLTSYQTIRETIPSIKNGVDDYIIKPFSEKELIAKINKIIKEI